MLEPQVMQMQANPRKAVVPLVAVVALVLGCAAISGLSLAAKRGIEPHKLAIMFSGDDLGTAKPCG
jgi:hypothetical protein